MGVLGAHVTQSLAVAPVHMAQVDSHAWQTLLLSAYAPSGQVATHDVPLNMGKLPLESHDVHAPACEQVWHDVSHAPQVVPSLCTNWPDGHTAVHVPAVLSKVTPARHAVQLVAVALLHSLHVLSQVEHRLLESEYFPPGHEATQVPLSKKGVPTDGQLTQSVLPGPLHVRHDEWHAMHVAAWPTWPE